MKIVKNKTPVNEIELREVDFERQIIICVYRETISRLSLCSQQGQFKYGFVYPAGGGIHSVFDTIKETIEHNLSSNDVNIYCYNNYHEFAEDIIKNNWK